MACSTRESARPERVVSEIAVPAAVPRTMKPPIGRRLAQALGRMVRHQLSIVGLILVVAQLAMALMAPALAPYEPNAIDVSAILNAPGLAHPLGTDDLGRDILSRLIFGARVSIGVGVMSVVMAVLAGVPIGLLTGYFGGVFDETLMRLLDSVMALPALVLALTIAAVLGIGLVNAMIAIAIVLAPIYTRLVRGQVLSVKHNDYVQAAHAVGVPTILILTRHILPNVLNPVIVQASLGVGFAIIIESSLSFIGLGAQPPTPTWGNMVQTGFQYLEIAPWYALAPAAMIFLAVLGFNMLGDGLRDLLDPTARSRL
jgi:ABC-type dipeptide/oligopeptide/nickel transport system permease subunit